MKKKTVIKKKMKKKNKMKKKIKGLIYQWQNKLNKVGDVKVEEKKIMNVDMLK